MRRGATLLVVAVVAAIVLAAGFDALRSGGSPQVDAGTQPETPAMSTAELDGATNYVPLQDEFGGTLYYTDENCELKAVALPDSRPSEAPSWDDCRFVLSPDGRRVSGAGSGWDPRSDPLIGRLFESSGGTIQVSTNHGPEGAPFAGVAPAWRPDGTLTYFANGAVRAWPEGRVVLSQHDLVRAMRRQPIRAVQNRFHRFRVRESAWLDDRRLAAIVSAEARSQEDEDLVAVYDGARIQDLYFDEPGGFSDLRTSPTGRYLAADTSGQRAPGDFLLAETGSGLVDTLGIADYRAITWSPDEQWVAVAAAGGVFVFRPGASGPPTREFAIDTLDLDWRGEVGPPALASTAAAREWLEHVGATGRLFLTHGPQLECSLRAVQLPDLEWADRPTGLPNPCRFTLAEDDEVLAENDVPRPGGGQWAVCQDSSVRQVFAAEGNVFSWPGCAPAWTPDGRLTFIRNGALFEGGAGEPKQRLLSRNAVSELLGRPSALEEVAWADDETFWAVVRSGESASVALMTTDRLEVLPSFVTREIEGLRVSASGMVAARTDQGVVFFDTGGRRAMTFPDGQAVAWAPGELVAAVATANEIRFVAPLSREVVSVPLAVRDLEWVVP